MIDSKKKEIVKRGNAFFPIQYYWSNTSSPLYKLPVHWHTDYEIIHVVEGNLNLVLGSKKVSLEKDDYCIIQDGVLHGDDENILPCKYESIVFDFNLLRMKEYAPDSFLNDIACHRIILNSIFKIANNAIKTETDSVFDLMRNKDNGYELVIVGRLLCLLGYIKNMHFYSEDNKPLDKRQFRSGQMRAVLNLIADQYSRQITLEELADKAGMSPKYFCRIFRKMTNRTPIEYLNAYRIDKSCSLIRNCDDSLMNIASNCGFKDFSYFIRIFKKFKGITPHKYRNFNLASELNQKDIIHN
ncbi:AraC family transcriptional regulator [Treponema sp.]|uniref:AraC family transcriptional regulator n=1 Tax=Treponema sp. TaxID=166 RepID=UPI00298E2F7D|nr:AraC family transcriptional regulator [Treponema sp.]MCR5612170.1 AraC family transcriptional regulator [Treponema sp.]